MDHLLMELDKRISAAQAILSSPKQYKVCECCGSIVRRRFAVCGNCNAYRFDERTDAVIRQAKVLSSRPAQSLAAADYS